MDGGCGCGRVRYSISSPQMPVIYACHCTDCQTQSGSAFALQMPIPESLLTLTGELVSGERTQPSGAIGTIYSCAHCLTRLYSENSMRPGVLVVRAGTLDASNQVVPKFHLWTQSKLNWVVIPANSIALEQQPASLVEWIALLSPVTQ